MKRVVITGLGCISPLGNSVDAMWSGLLDGHCAIDFIQSIDTADLPVKVGAEVKDFRPEDYGLQAAPKEEIVGGTPEENARTTRGILAGEITGAKRDIVLMNAGASLYVAGKTDSIREGVKLAAELIESGKAVKKIDEMAEVSNG